MFRLCRKLSPFLLLPFMWFGLAVETIAQEEGFNFSIGFESGYNPDGRMPFWFRANQNGNIPSEGFTAGLLIAAEKPYMRSGKTVFDWMVSAGGRLNSGKDPRYILWKANAGVRIGIFEILGGRNTLTMGLCDTALSSGSFAVSGNAPGIPSLSLSIPGYYTIPFFGGLFAFKGGFNNGLTGKIPRKNADNITLLNSFFHQTWFYGRIGKQTADFRIYGGFNHQVFWGNEKAYYGESFTLSPAKTFLYVITGKTYGNEEIAHSRIGNHLGSVDLGFEFEAAGSRFLVYRQTFYDIGALYHMANLRDGLYGLSLTNLNESDKAFHWKKFTLEYLFAKNQAGEYWSPVTPSGDEDYYNNYQFVKGYSYFGYSIGTPFIGTREYIRDDLPGSPNDYFINNRVIVFHIASEVHAGEWDITLKSSWSWNRGTYATSVEGRSLGSQRDAPEADIFPLTRQYSGFISLQRKFGETITGGLRAALDNGQLYRNTSGVLISLTGSF